MSDSKTAPSSLQILRTSYLERGLWQSCSPLSWQALDEPTDLASCLHTGCLFTGLSKTHLDVEGHSHEVGTPVELVQMSAPSQGSPQNAWAPISHAETSLPVPACASTRIPALCSTLFQLALPRLYQLCVHHIAIVLFNFFRRCLLDCWHLARSLELFLLRFFT